MLNSIDLSRVLTVNFCQAAPYECTTHICNVTSCYRTQHKAMICPDD